MPNSGGISWDRGSGGFDGADVDPDIAATTALSTRRPLPRLTEADLTSRDWVFRRFERD